MGSLQKFVKTGALTLGIIFATAAAPHDISAQDHKASLFNISRSALSLQPSVSAETINNPSADKIELVTVNKPQKYPGPGFVQSLRYDPGIRGMTDLFNYRNMHTPLTKDLDLAVRWGSKRTTISLQYRF